LLKVEVTFDEAIAAERARLAKEPLLDTERLSHLKYLSSVICLDDSYGIFWIVFPFH